MLSITEYAQRLIDDLDTVDYIDRVKTSQINWIGRSTGAEVDFATTAGDTPHRIHHPPGYPLWRHLYGHRAGASLYREVGGPHRPIWKPCAPIRQKLPARAISSVAKWLPTRKRPACCIEGVRGINPVNGEEIPIFISDYVLMTYGTGAIMAVPGSR